MIEFFNHLNSLQPLSSEAVAALLKVIKAKELRRGQVWLQEGAVCDKFTFVIKGLMKLYFETGSKEVILNFAREKEFMISAQSYFDQSPSRYTIRSVQQSVVVYVLIHELQSTIDRFPELNLHFSLVAHKQVVEYEYHTGLMMLQPRERYDRLIEEKSWMVNRKVLTDKLLAGYLGIGANVLSGYKRGDIS